MLLALVDCSRMLMLLVMGALIDILMIFLRFLSSSLAGLTVEVGGSWWPWGVLLGGVLYLLARWVSIFLGSGKLSCAPGLLDRCDR